MIKDTLTVILMLNLYHTDTPQDKDNTRVNCMFDLYMYVK